MDNFTALALNFISQWGYLGLGLGMAWEFLGLPFPGEVALTTSGILIGQGHLRLLPALIAAGLGSWLGSMGAYGLGRLFGLRLLSKYGKYVFMTAPKISRAQVWFNRHGILILVLGRFLPGFRPLSSYLAGAANMSWGHFWPYSLAGTILWTATFIFTGRFIGANWTRTLALLDDWGWWLLVVAAVLALGYYAYRRIRRHHDGLKKPFFLSGPVESGSPRPPGRATTDQNLTRY